MEGMEPKRAGPKKGGAEQKRAFHKDRSGQRRETDEDGETDFDGPPE